MVESTSAKGERIREAIRQSGKTQREIADLIGVAPQSVTKWIKTGKIYIENLQALAEITGSDLRYLVSGESLSHGVSEPNANYSTKQADLRQIISQLNSEQASKLLMCARAILDSSPEIEINISIGERKI